MIRFSTGNMFDAPAEAFVNTVNLVGVMGKGVALQFKERFDHNFKVYQQACKDQTIGIGNSLVVREDWNGRNIWVINFPTKIHWRNPSEYRYVENGLDNLAKIICEYNIKSIAIPPLGAGNGGLEWARVKQMIVDKLSGIDCDILVYEPGYKVLSIDRKVRLTPARALLVYMLDRIQQEGHDATIFAAVKSIYFMQKFGADSIFKMNFKRHLYGPYCDSVRHLLRGIDGAFITGFADMSKKPFEPFDTIHERLAEVQEMVNQDLMLSNIVSRTCQFLDGYWDDFNLELISSVDFLISEHPQASSEEIYDLLVQWNERKRQLFSTHALVKKAYEHVVG